MFIIRNSVDKYSFLTFLIKKCDNLFRFLVKKILTLFQRIKCSKKKKKTREKEAKLIFRETIKFQNKRKLILVAILLKYPYNLFIYIYKWWIIRSFFYSTFDLNKKIRTIQIFLIMYILYMLVDPCFFKLELLEILDFLIVCLLYNAPYKFWKKLQKYNIIKTWSFRWYFSITFFKSNSNFKTFNNFCLNVWTHK